MPGGLTRVKSVDWVEINYDNNYPDHENYHGTADLKQKKFRIHSHLPEDVVKIVVNTGQTIKTDEILFMHRSGEICCIHTLKGNFRIESGLNEMLETLSFRNMLRVQESCAVNIERISAFDDAALYLAKNGEFVTIPYGEKDAATMHFLCPMEDPVFRMAELIVNIDPTMKRWFLKVEKVMQRLLKENLLSVCLVAEEISISERQMQRLFRKHLGISPADYVAQIRLEYARKLMIEHPSYPVQKIASRAGFHDVNYFRKIYRRRFGTDPVSG